MDTVAKYVESIADSISACRSIIIDPASTDIPVEERTSVALRLADFEKRFATAQKTGWPFPETFQAEIIEIIDDLNTLWARHVLPRIKPQGRA